MPTHAVAAHKRSRNEGRNGARTNNMDLKMFSGVIIATTGQAAIAMVTAAVALTLMVLMAEHAAQTAGFEARPTLFNPNTNTGL